MRAWGCLVSTLSVLLHLSNADQRQNAASRPKRNMFLPGRDLVKAEASGAIQEARFQQLLDHSNPGLGTFSQRYWYSTEYWGGLGHPVVLFNAGEVNATGYLGYCTNATITGMLAQRVGAATILIEHRYWGESSPFSELTTANMTYLTLENAMQDMTYFANTVQLPFDVENKSNAGVVPWVLVGGSYPGALASYIASVHPGTFWAYLATSAPVQVISDFWSYFLPVQDALPQNCTTDVNKVIGYMDNVIQHGSEDEIHALKTKFGLEQVQDNVDFMAALENGPWEWQETSFTAPNQATLWCDYVENAVNSSSGSLPGPEGVGIEKALEGYALWFRNVQNPNFCKNTYGYFQGENNTDCYDTFNASNPIFADTSLSNTGQRQWNWILCNEPFGFWQDGAQNSSYLVSHLVDAQYWIRQCGLYFPSGPQGQTYGIAKGRTEAQVNARTGGWNMLQTRSIERLVMTNGEFDPWRSGSTASQLRPGGPVTINNDNIMTNLIPNGVHCSDLVASNGEANEGIARVQQAEIEQIVKWIGEWPGKPGGYEA